MIPRGEKAAHEAACPHRLVACGNEGCSKQDVPANMAVHRLSCGHRTLVCPHGCGASLKGSQETSHGQQCPAKLVDCECADLGCRTKVERGLGRIVALHHCPSTLHQILSLRNATNSLHTRCASIFGASYF